MKLASAGLLALVLLCVAAPAADARQKRVLLVSEARGFVHDSIPNAVGLFERLGRRSRRYDVSRLRGGARQLTAARLKRSHAVVFANTSGELALPDRAALARFVASGGALVGTHSAADTLHSWPGFHRMLGGEFKRHGMPTSARLVVEDRRHPATRRLPRSFRLREEFYEFTPPPRRRVHVLVRLDTQTIGDELRSDVPLVWCRRYGRGRIFYDALGHFPATWSDVRQRRLVAGGLAWALRLESGPRC